MTNYEFKQAIKTTNRKLTSRPTAEDMAEIKRLHSEGKIINPGITCKGVANLRAPKTDEEKLLLQFVVANLVLVGLSSQQISENAKVVWDIIDAK